MIIGQSVPSDSALPEEELGMRRSILRDAVRQAEVERTGFAIVPLLDAEEVAGLRRDLSLLREKDFQPSTIVGRNLSYHSTSLDPDTAYRTGTFALVRDAVAQPLRHLLDGFDIVTASVIMKEPGTGILPLHCDWTMTEDPDDVTLTIWCPLVDVDESNGCLHVVPSSHRLLRQIRGPGIKNYHSRFQRELKDLGIPVPMRAGEAVIFETSLLHGSPLNGSEFNRPALMISCIPSGNRPVFYRYEDASGEKRFEMFDASDTGFREHPANSYFAGLVTDTLIARVPNEGGTISWTGFRHRLTFARLWRRLFGGRDLYRLFDRLPGFS